MRYALTGATGFVGGELARQLVDAGHDVVALVRTPRRATGLAELGVELVEGDLDSAPALDRLLAGADGLFHVAGWYRLGDRDLSAGERVNVEGTRNVLEAALRAGTPKVVHTSTLAVNSDTGGAVRDETHRHTGSHITEYDRTKARAHDVAHELAARGLPVVTVMPGAIDGPGDTSQVGELVAQVVAGRRPQVPLGGGTLMWATSATWRGGTCSRWSVEERARTTCSPVSPRPWRACSSRWVPSRGPSGPGSCHESSSASPRRP